MLELHLQMRTMLEQKAQVNAATTNGQVTT